MRLQRSLKGWFVQWLILSVSLSLNTGFHPMPRKELRPLTHNRLGGWHHDTEENSDAPNMTRRCWAYDDPGLQDTWECVVRHAVEHSSGPLLSDLHHRFTVDKLLVYANAVRQIVPSHADVIKI